MQLAPDCRTVKRAREHPQPVQPTVPRRLGKAAGNLQEREEISRLHKRRTEFIELCALGHNAIRPIFLEPMREIAARDADSAPPELLRRRSNRLSEQGVRMRGQPRNADADEFGRRIAEVCTQKEKRNHRPVIECRILFPERPRRNIAFPRRRRECAHEFHIVFDPDCDLWMSKRGKIPLCRLARRDVEEIIVCCRVRADDDDGIGA